MWHFNCAVGYFERLFAKSLFGESGNGSCCSGVTPYPQSTHTRDWFLIKNKHLCQQRGKGLICSPDLELLPILYRERWNLSALLLLIWFAALFRPFVEPAAPADWLIARRREGGYFFAVYIWTFPTRPCRIVLSRLFDFDWHLPARSIIYDTCLRHLLECEKAFFDICFSGENNPRRV